MPRRPLHIHCRVVPNNRIEEFTYSGTYDELPVNVIPIILDENNYMLPNALLSDETIPPNIRAAISLLEEREFDVVL